METIDVCYANTKNGTYVQFLLPVHTCELSELNLYDQFLQKSIRQDFGVLFDTYGMEFTTDNSYILTQGGGVKLAICLNGTTSPALESTLDRIGIEKRELHLQ